MGPWGRRNEEYMADFCLLARRAIADSDTYRLFNEYFLLCVDWRACCERHKLHRGSLYRKLWEIEERCGRAFRETRPYALYPLDEYFAVRKG